MCLRILKVSERTPFEREVPGFLKKVVPRVVGIFLAPECSLDQGVCPAGVELSREVRDVTRVRELVRHAVDLVADESHVPPSL